MKQESNYDKVHELNIKALCSLVHHLAKAKGWHPKKYTAKDRERLIMTTVANVHGEVSELWEAFRKGELNEPCDKSGKMIELNLVPLTCAEEELADIVIRVMDTSEALGINLGRAIMVKHRYNSTRAFRHGNKKA